MRKAISTVIASALLVGGLCLIGVQLIPSDVPPRKLTLLIGAYPAVVGALWAGR
jgi:hypothetical protein